MKRKEWREVARQSAYFLLAAAAMMLLVAIADWAQGRAMDGERIVILLGLFLLMFSLFLGLSPFALDSKQRGMEYLLTLPLPRRRLLLIKFLPRLAAVAFFCLAFVLVYALAGDGAFAGGFAFFALAYFALFLISFSLSLFHENFVVQSIAAGAAWCGYLALCLLIVLLGFTWKFRLPLAWIGSGIWNDLSFDLLTLLVSIAVFLLLAAPFTLSLFIAFQRFDLKPARAFNRRQLLVFAPLLLLALAAALGITYAVQSRSPYWESELFILKGQRLLKADFPGKLTLFATAGSERVDTKSAVFWDRLLLEQEGRLYLSGYDTKDGSRIIGCLDQADLSWKTLYRSQERHFIIVNGAMGVRYDGRQFVYLRGGQGDPVKPDMGGGQAPRSNELELVRVEPASGAATAIRFPLPPVPGRWHPWLIGSGEQGGRRFWLVDIQWRNVLRLWEDGRVEDLGVSRGSTNYVDGLLLARGDRSLIVRRIAGGGGEVVKEIEGRFDLPNLSCSSLSLQGWAGETYAVRGERLVRIGLSDLTVEDVGPAQGNIWVVPPGDFYYVESEGSPGQNADKWKRLYRLRDGRMEFLKQFDFSAGVTGSLFVDANGVILYQAKPARGSQVGRASRRAFAFPDLRELRFAGAH
jgi:hypothetical protein